MHKRLSLIKATSQLTNTLYSFPDRNWVGYFVYIDLSSMGDFMTIATNGDNLMDNTSMRSLREQRRVDWKERIFHGLFMTSAVIGILSLAINAYFIVRESIPAFQEAGVTGIVLRQDWLPPALYGVATMIVTSVVSTFGAVIVGFQLVFSRLFYR